MRKARQLLAESTNAYGQSDIRELVNHAISALSGMKGWECLRKVLRFPCIGPRFFLPQGCAGLVRACVNGRPATVRAQDFSFMHSGPGDAVRPPSGFVPVRASNVVDAGVEPVMVEPVGPCRIGAWSPVGSPSGAGAHVSLRCLAPDGRCVSVRVPVNEDPVYDSSGELASGVSLLDGTWSSEPVQTVVEAVLELPDNYGEYVTLYARDYASGAVYPIAYYNPEVEVPTFRHYRISDIPPGMPVEILAEVRLEPLPLIKDTDVLPFSNVNPVEWVIRGDWYMKSGEADTAQKYYSMAAQWLQAQETTDTTVQTAIVVNSRFAGSPGEVSMEAENI